MPSKAAARAGRPDTSNASSGPALRSEDSVAQHRAILRAIRRGQPAAAERAMRDHLAHLADALADVEAQRG